jgi:serine-aspartate repeat-containing protein C/D/E
MPKHNDDALTTIGGAFRIEAVLGDRIWRDNNANGVQDSDEPGIANVVVNLLSDNNVVASVASDNNGLYRFTEEKHGLAALVDYQLSLPLSSLPLVGLDASPNDQNSDDETDSDGLFIAGDAVVRVDVRLSAIGQRRFDVDFGFCDQTLIGDRVWHDLNANGIQDSNEPGLSSKCITV